MSHTAGKLATFAVHLGDWQNDGLRGDILGVLRHSNQRLIGITLDEDGHVLVTIEEGAD